MKTDSKSTQIVRKLFLSLLPVQALAVGLPAINALLSSFIVGNALGASALAAIGFADPLNNLVAAITGILSSGSQLLCGQYLGKGNEKGIRNAFTVTVGLCLVLSVPIAAVMLLAPMQLAALLGASGEAQTLTAQYLRGLAPSVLFSMQLACLLPFLQMDRAAKASSLSVTVMVVVKLGGDFLNAFVFKGGIGGVGLTTTLGNVFAVLVTLPHFMHKSKLFRLSFKELDLSVLKEIFYQGMPAAVHPGGLMVRNRLVNAMVFRFGGIVGMSAMAVANNITTAIGCVVESGYSGASRLIACVLTGERDTSSLRDLPSVMAKAAGPLYLGAYAIVFFFAAPLARLFGAEAENMEMYVMAIRLFNLWYVTNIFKAPPLSIYQAMEEVKLMTAMTVLGDVVFPAFLCLTVGNLIGIAVPLSLTWLDEVLLMLFMAGYFRYRAGRWPRSLTELTYIPSSISAPRENRYKAVIRTEADAVQASEEAVDFCIRKGMSRRSANYCGLCIEEMAVDAIRNRFKNQKQTIDLRIIYENEEIRILLRDDSEKFDPNEWLALCAPEEAERSIGIRMVSKIAKEMNYSCALGLNVLTIRI